MSERYSDRCTHSLMKRVVGRRFSYVVPGKAFQQSIHDSLSMPLHRFCKSNIILTKPQTQFWDILEVWDLQTQWIFVKVRVFEWSNNRTTFHMHVISLLANSGTILLVCCYACNQPVFLPTVVRYYWFAAMHVTSLLANSGTVLLVCCYACNQPSCQQRVDITGLLPCTWHMV